MLFPDRIERVRPTIKQGAYGEYEDWEDPIITPVDSPVWIQPLTSTEYYDGVGNTQVVTGYRLISAPGHVLDLDSNDRLRIVGEDRQYFVDGRPAQWGRPLPHTDAKLEIVEGFGVE